MEDNEHTIYNNNYQSHHLFVVGGMRVPRKLRAMPAEA
jgi:hypothetical protein